MLIEYPNDTTKLLFLVTCRKLCQGVCIMLEVFTDDFYNYLSELYSWDGLQTYKIVKLLTRKLIVLDQIESVVYNKQGKDPILDWYQSLNIPNKDSDWPTLFSLYFNVWHQFLSVIVFIDLKPFPSLDCLTRINLELFPTRHISIFYYKHLLYIIIDFLEILTNNSWVRWSTTYMSLFIL